MTHLPGLDTAGTIRKMKETAKAKEELAKRLPRGRTIAETVAEAEAAAKAIADGTADQYDE